MQQINVADDMLRGAKQIAEYLGEPLSRVQYMLARQLIPGIRVGGRFYMRKSTYLAHIERLESGQNAA